MGAVEKHPPPELQRAAAAEKHAHQQARIAQRDGYAATVEGGAITREWLPAFTEKLKGVLSLGALNARPVHKEFMTLICESVSNKKITPELLALCVLNGALYSIGVNENYTKTAVAIGNNIHAECLRADLLKSDPTLAKRIERLVAEAGPIARRQDKARREAEREGYKTPEWNEEMRVKAGNWAINQLLEHLPDVFARDDDSGQEKYLTLTSEAAAYATAYAEQYTADVIRRNSGAPETKAPRPWTAWNEGGTWDLKRQQFLHVMRAWHPQTAEAVTLAINDGSMKPALKALNTLQSVPWKMNTRVLEVMRACAERGINVKGLPAANVSITVPEGLNTAQRKIWAKKKKIARRKNRVNRSNRLMLAIDLKTAMMLAEHPRFYTPMNFDWRGRINALPHFNIQRGDYVRALFLFADGAPIGEEGLRWLKVHTANCGNFEKISKQPFDARIAWVDAHREDIERTAAAPLENIDWWSKASEPFQFLAACFDLADALSTGPAHVSHLPVSFDGSCSGLQHLCAMTRAPEGRLVNLTPNQTPQDIYQTVAERTREQINNDTARKTAPYKKMWTAYDQKKGITRDTVKNNVMVYGYSGTLSGMADVQRAKVIDPENDTAVLAGTAPPFSDDWKQAYGAARYMANQVNAAIERTIEGPARAKDFLRTLSTAVSKVDKPLRWKTPVGIPWLNLYFVPRYKRIQLWLLDWPVPYKTKWIVGEEPKINKKKAANGAAPNFVHACDAAHLMLTVNAAAKADITSIATVHDSFGCHAAHAEQFREIIKEQFVRLYEEHDVLAEVLKQARRDLGETGGASLPSEPPQQGTQQGTLNIKDVRKAEYAFA